MPSSMVRVLSVNGIHNSFPLPFLLLRDGQSGGQGAMASEFWGATTAIENPANIDFAFTE